jgi:hypothetical protein
MDAVAHQAHRPDKRRDQVPQGHQENCAEQFAAEGSPVVEDDLYGSKPYRHSHRKY